MAGRAAEVSCGAEIVRCCGLNNPAIKSRDRVEIHMKPFLYGLTLAVGMALLNAAAASPGAPFCVVLPNFEPSRIDVDLTDDNCVLACARRGNGVGHQ